MPTPLQIKLIHVAHQQAGLSREQYKMVLRSAGNVESCKDLDQGGYEDCMAVLEDSGFRERDKPGDYWRAKVAARGTHAGGRMAYKIHELAERSRYDLAAMCRKFSEDRAEEPEQLTPREAWKLIEMLKAEVKREDVKREGAASPAPPPSPSLFGSPSDLGVSAPRRSIPPVQAAAVEDEEPPF